MRLHLAVLCVILSASCAFPRPVRQMGDASLQRFAAMASRQPTSGRTKCDVCKIAVSDILLLKKLHLTEDAIADVITDICILGKIEDKPVCRAAVAEFRTEVLSVIDAANWTADELCGRVLGPSCANVSGQQWTVSFPDTPKPPVLPLVPPKPTTPKWRILYLSDIHLDLNYTEGLDTNCGEPLCCRPPNKFVGKAGAGKWGDYKCDFPLATLQNLLEFISQNVEFDFVYWTGDIPPHDVWNQTQQEQLNVNQVLANLLKKYFPHKVIYPSLGNHESAPVNSFPPPFIKGKSSEAWLYDAVAMDWSSWLSNDTLTTVHYAGFYSVQPLPNFRIISLNVNFCSRLNFWLLINETDPAGQLQWLVNQLQDAEDKKQKVHIIGHIPPPNGGCLEAWSANYERIINRYESTVAAQIFGHTHKTHVSVFFNESRPVSVLYTGPSVTTYLDLNPAFRIFEVDGAHKESTFRVLDYEDYIMNLTEANFPGGKPQWRKEYSARDAYNLAWLFPSDWAGFIARCKENSTWIQLYNKFRHHSHVTEPCNAACQSSLLCEMQRSRAGAPCPGKLPGIADEDIIQHRQKNDNMC